MLRLFSRKSSPCSQSCRFSCAFCLLVWICNENQWKTQPPIALPHSTLTFPETPLMDQVQGTSITFRRSSVASSGCSRAGPLQGVLSSAQGMRELPPRQKSSTHAEQLPFTNAHKHHVDSIQVPDVHPVDGLNQEGAVSNTDRASQSRRMPEKVPISSPHSGNVQWACHGHTPIRLFSLCKPLKFQCQ